MIFAEPPKTVDHFYMFSYHCLFDAYVGDAELSVKYRIFQIVNLFRIIPVWIILHCIEKNKQDVIWDELLYWNDCKQLYLKFKFDMLSIMLALYPEYSNLLQYRVGGYLKYIIKFLFPGMETLYINAKTIGKRLYIQHGFSTILACEKIGSNCWINQQVTVGWGFDGTPTIGNGVRVSAGAKVIGNVTVGDNAIVGANAVVVKNVPKNSIVGGVPAKLIGYNKDHILYIKN